MDSRQRSATLGRLGETRLAPDWLAREGFAVTNLNAARGNQPFGDLLLVRGDERYFTSVKTRNKNRDHGGLNMACNTYHCFADDELDDQITSDLHNGRP